VNLLKQILAVIDCVKRGKCVYDLAGKCVHCGAHATDPTIGEMLSRAWYPKENEEKLP
jgi:hypothetical protein